MCNLCIAVVGNDRGLQPKSMFNKAILFVIMTDEKVVVYRGDFRTVNGKCVIGRSSKIVRRMNKVVLEYLRSSDEGTRIVDWSKILLDRNSPQKKPQTHPGRVASLAYMNMVLNNAATLCK